MILTSLTISLRDRKYVFSLSAKCVGALQRAQEYLRNVSKAFLVLFTKAQTSDSAQPLYSIRLLCNGSEPLFSLLSLLLQAFRQ